RDRRRRCPASAAEARHAAAATRSVRWRGVAPAGAAARRTHSVEATPRLGRDTSPRGPRPRPSAWPARPGADLARALRPPRRTGWRWRRSTTSRRRSWLLLPEPIRQQLAQAAQLLLTEVLVGYQLGQEQLGRAVEHLVHQAAECRATGGFPFDQRLVAVRAAVFGVTHVSLLLERTEDGEDGRVGEVVGNPLANLGDGGRPHVPQHAHHVELSIGEADAHGRPHLLAL